MLSTITHNENSHQGQVDSIRIGNFGSFWIISRGVPTCDRWYPQGGKWMKMGHCLPFYIHNLLVSGVLSNPARITVHRLIYDLKVWDILCLRQRPHKLGDGNWFNTQWILQRSRAVLTRFADAFFPQGLCDIVELRSEWNTHISIAWFHLRQRLGCNHQSDPVRSSESFVVFQL